MRKNLLVGTTAAISAMLLVATPAFAGGSGAQKAPLVANTFQLCSGQSIGPPSAVNGFAVINAHDGVVSAVVSLKNATPNQTYGVDLVQTTSGTGCNIYSAASLTTNGQGNGNVTITVPQVTGDTGAFVGLFYGNYGDFFNTTNVSLS